MTCNLAKTHRLPFGSTEHRIVAFLQLIHFDVWQSPVISYNGFKYYVLFIDNYSRFIWLYLMKCNCEVYDRFTKFQALVENLFDS